MSVDDFRNDLISLPEMELVEKYYVSAGALHVDDASIEHIRKVVAASYGIDPSGLDVRITGSAKIGFTTFDKKLEDGSLRPRYSQFDFSSDIDVSIIAPNLFQSIWLELASYSAKKTHFPWRSERLGDYLVCGWLRPDHFPKVTQLYQTQEWWPTFERLSRSSRFGRRKVTGALFQSFDHLLINLERIVRSARRQELGI